jgi:dynein heavy chain 1
LKKFIPSDHYQDWIHQLLARLDHIEALMSNTNMTQFKGSLFFRPDAFLTATRQSIAKQMSWPLETLELTVDIGQSSPPSFALKGILIEGAHWINERLVLKEGIHELPVVYLGWSLKKGTVDSIGIPIYCDRQRQTLWCTAHIPVQHCDQVQQLVTHGIAMFL